MNLAKIQSLLKIKHGSFNEEIVEQTMASMFLKPTDVVLELGSNIGRNSLVVASILNSSSNLVTLEMDSEFATKCEENKVLNGFNFHLVNAALSYIPLYCQNKKHGEGGGYCVDTKYTNDYVPCKTVTFEDLEAQYNLKFTVLVVDCEGGFYHIIKSNPNILNNIRLLIIENDFPVIQHKNFLNDLLFRKGFSCVYSKKLESESDFPCKDFFWETWEKV